MLFEWKISPEGISCSNINILKTHYVLQTQLV